ncbi:MAG: 3-phosphoshikimate 1-carboxyvinyltransferase [Deltaproteobacteria bacterium]|nr:3-phosphoshikimate 1-carboxyvinyltransferase [Deltaproteobacteria bacterium]
MKKKFFFKGTLPASKSILNRLLVIQSYCGPEDSFIIQGDSDCDDVVAMKNGIAALMAGKDVDCGAAGTVIRFLTLRAARLSGEFHFTGTKRLLERPMESLQDLSRQLKSGSHEIRIDCSKSSQFASAVLLNAWDLPFELRLKLEHLSLSEGYFEMTKAMVRMCGMELLEEGNGVVIPSHQSVRAGEYRAEPDMSSAFAIAALAAVAGAAEINAFPMQSLQPDSVFPEFLRLLGVSADLHNATLMVEGREKLHAVERDFSRCPDMFPVAAVLCALAQGTSKLYGAPHLAHKESNRIQKTAELIHKMGAHVHTLSDGLEIKGCGMKPSVDACVFNPDEDHRLVMAAAVVNAAGCNLEILHPEVVNKSFPEFLEIASH